MKALLENEDRTRKNSVLTKAMTSESFIEWAREFVKDNLPFLFEKMFELDDGEALQKDFEHCRSHFGDNIAYWDQRLREFMFEEESVMTNLDPIDQDERASIDVEIETLLNKGIPLSRMSLKTYRRARPANNPGGIDEGLDAFYLLRRVIYHLVKGFYGENGICRIHNLARRDHLGEVKPYSISPDDREASVMIDRRRCGFFVTNVEDGGKIMRLQMAVIKTLWDLSCNIRGRRFNDMINSSHLTDNNKPDKSDE